MKTVPIACAFDFEQSPESFHAHAIPENVQIYPGDVVLIHDAPADFGFGDVIVGEGTGTLYRAGLLTRTWTVLSSIFEITELFEVGFQPYEPVKG